ncbi:hypothetical protein [Micromonospora rubida]|uniref:hypothetical protein n=1 Tax=Micromonospora rubida TaxID=2697657 RepID=UPI001377AE79|nr:hypothetical protein [Micromonospora rubida]NBE84943.1 hypothetical protein [Micromonospora rubida]
MNLDNAVDFFNEFLDAEHQQAMAALTEPDDVLEERRDITQGLMHSPPGTIMASPIGRALGHSVEELVEFSANASRPQRRTLFLVAEYRNTTWQALFAGYTSGAHPDTSLAYERLYYAREVEGAPKMISEYLIEIEFETDAEVQWRHAQGVKVPNPGQLVAAQAIREPVLEEQRRSWENIVQQANQNRQPD